MVTDTKGWNMRKDGFTLIELLIVVAIVGILAAILFPVFSRARENARRSSCMSNLKQMGLGMMMYSQDYDERMMNLSLGTKDDGSKAFTLSSGAKADWIMWRDQIYPYVKNAQVYNCPSADSSIYWKTGSTSAWLSYAYNYAKPYGPLFSGEAQGIDMGPERKAGAPLSAIPVPSETIAITEGSVDRVNPAFYTTATWLPRRATEETLKATGTCSAGAVNYLSCLRSRHLDTMNTLFVDGHVKAMPWKSILMDGDSVAQMKYWTTADLEALSH